MEITDGLVTVAAVALPEGRAINTGQFSSRACFTPSMVWILEKPGSLLPQAK
jgi:hypothetical protein